MKTYRVTWSKPQSAETQKSRTVSIENRQRSADGCVEVAARQLDSADIAACCMHTAVQCIGLRR